MLLEGCRQDEHRTLPGHTSTVGVAMAIARDQLQPLVQESFDLAAVGFPAVDRSGCVKVRTNFYSAPVAVGTSVTANLHAAHVEIWHQGHCVEWHRRCFDRHQKVLALDHHLEALTRKSSAMAGSAASETGCSDPAETRHFLYEQALERPATEGVDIGDLNRYDRPEPSLNGYDLLLSQRTWPPLAVRP